MEENTYTLLRWVPILPFIGFMLNGLAGRWLPEKIVGLTGSGVIGGSLILSIVSFSRLIALSEENRLLLDNFYTWISSGELDIAFSFRMDALSAVMALVVSGVSFLIHIYSIGYMKGDRGFWRYFAYLNLFVFFMLILVLADNLLLMFVGWEGVGLCSYLLIGFWYEDEEKAEAGKKAFVVNRIGDAGFILGLLLLFFSLGVKGVFDLDFRSLELHVLQLADDRLWGVSVPLLIGLLLFLGATGKSAQFPLYVWLPDAMAGPTPVSALIHAATMVTAGVYMLTRMRFIYEVAPDALGIVLVIGCFTAFLGACIGLLQKDIKKVLAYSTISQLGYMFMAVGAGAYAVGIFHLTTHAFFKALLFLGAGSVIHGLHGEQDMTRMGGLRKEMKITFILTFFAYLAISGIPPLAGFFSKDKILESVFVSGHKFVWFIGLMTAGMTSFYISRLIILTFLGEKKGHKAHESPGIMTIPMAILGFLSVTGGLIGVKSLLGGSDILHFLSAWGSSHEREIEGTTERILIMLSVFAGFTGIALAFFIYSRERAEVLKRNLEHLHRVIFNKFYVDEIYNVLFVRTLRWFSHRFCFRFFDAGLIDGFMVNGLAKFFYNTGNIMKRLQSGNAQSYAFVFLLGVIATLYYLLKRFL